MASTTAETPWQISGEYFESCSCTYVCPCPTSNLEARPTKGTCTAVLAFRINEGRYGTTPLNGLHFVVVLRTPQEMIKGNWSVGVITDERADAQQQKALAGIAGGQAGGPMAGLASLVGTFLGTESRAIRFQKDGLSWSLSVPDAVDQAVAGVPGANQAEPIYLDNVGHPVASRIALAKATRSHLHAFGLDWDDDSGQNNGHFAPFSWRAG